MNPTKYGIVAGAVLALAATPAIRAADATVATAVYGRVGNGYQREKLKDGSFKPERYALSNGGKIYGTTTDLTVDRVGYPQVAEIAMKLLAKQNYHYAQKAEEATLLLVLQWGNTIGFDRSSYSHNVTNAGNIYADLQNALRASGVDVSSVRGSGDISIKPAEGGAPDPVHVWDALGRFESAMIRIFADNQARDRINQHNARVVGYMDDLNDSNDIRRWAGGGDRYKDLIEDVEETRYYIVISAFDFAELTRHEKKKLLWQVRVSVRSPGNAFDDSLAAMMKSASRYFGQDSGKLVRSEESKGTVELGDLQILGESKEPAKPSTKEKK